MEKYTQVIFICTGNTCRSPMAEGLLKSVYKKNDINIGSRGLMVFGNEGADPSAIKAMKEKGIHIENHLARPFDKDDYSSKTLILTMTNSHKTVVKQHGFAGDIYTLKEYVGQEGDVKDPYGGDMKTYRKCCAELEELINLLNANL